jgi:hypothetical protein
MLKAYRLSDIMRAILANTKDSWSRHFSATSVLRDIEGWPGRSFANRARNLPNTLSWALGVSPPTNDERWETTLERLARLTLAEAKRLNVQPVDCDLKKERP